VGVAVLGLEVPHAHIHLIPLQNEGDMNFHNHVKLTEEEFKQLAAELAANFE
jgi:histidine triad (HIT) family protein